MSDLYAELEQMCGLIKHAPEQVDLQDVRALLRRCQYYVELVGQTLDEATVTVPGQRVATLMDEATRST